MKRIASVILTFMFCLALFQTSVFAGVKVERVKVSDPYNLKSGIGMDLAVDDCAFVISNAYYGEDNHSKNVMYKPNGVIQFDFNNYASKNFTRVILNIKTSKYKVLYKNLGDKKWTRCSKSVMPEIYSRETNHDSDIINAVKAIKGVKDINERKVKIKDFLVSRFCSLNIDDTYEVKGNSKSEVYYKIDNYGIDGVKYSRTYKYSFRPIGDNKYEFYDFKITDNLNADKIVCSKTILKLK